MASSVPVGEPVHESARVPLGVTTTERTAQHIRTAVDAELASAISRLQEAQQHEARHLKISIDGMVHMARARVDDTVESSINAQLEPALRSYVTNAPQVRLLVSDVSNTLEQRVEANAAAVVTRLASEEVARRALCDSIEMRLQKQIDSRIGSYWLGLVMGVGIGAVGMWFARRTRNDSLNG